MPHRWQLLFFCLTASFLTSMSATIVVVVLPAMGRSLAANEAELLWVVSGYALAYGVVPTLAGRLGDDYGRRRMLLIGVVGFVVTSAMVAIAPNPDLLIAARLVQGVAAGMINPQISGLIQRMFSPQERGGPFSAVGVSNAIATAGGPAVGGLLMLAGGQDLGWRLAFLLNVPFGIVWLVVCARRLPRDPPSRHRRLDLVGALLLASGVLLVLLPAVEFNARHQPVLFVLLVPAAGLLALFIAWERRVAARGGHPLVEPALLRITTFTSGLGIGFMFFAAYSAEPLILTLFLQDGHGLSAVHAGLIAAAYALGAIASAPIAGRLVGRYGRRLTVASLVVLAVGIVMLLVTAVVGTELSADALALALLVPLVVSGFGGGAVANPNQALTLVDVDLRSASTAGGMLQSAQRVGGAFGVVVVATVFNGVLLHDAGLTHDLRYRNAYAAGLAVMIGLVLVAIVLAVVDARRDHER